MIFAAPLWLLGLLPWAAAAIWLLAGKTPRQRVPFLKLWQQDVPPPPPKRALRLPPLALVLAILALLLMVLACAQPRLTFAGYGGEPWRVVVDRGDVGSMGDPPRYVRLASELAQALPAELPVEVHVVPALESFPRLTTAGALPGVVGELERTAVETAGGMDGLLSRLRAASDDASPSGDASPIVVLGDTSDSGVIGVSRSDLLENVGFTHVSARVVEGRAYLLLRIRNDSPATSCEVEMVAGEERSARSVEVTANAESEVVIEAPNADRYVLRIVGDDAHAADNRWMLLASRQADLVVRGEVASPVARFAEAWRQRREAGGALISLSQSPLGADDRGVQIVPASGEAGDKQWQAFPEDFPVSAVDFRALGVSTVEAPAWFEPVVKLDDRPAIAIGREPRQLWIAGDIEAWAESPDFVIFMAAAVEWLSAPHRASWVALADLGDAEPVDVLAGYDREHSPGVWKRQGQTVAANARAPAMGEGVGSDWRAQVRAALGQQPLGMDVSAWVLVLACGLLLGAVGCWPKSR